MKLRDFFTPKRRLIVWVVGVVAFLLALSGGLIFSPHPSQLTCTRHLDAPLFDCELLSEGLFSFPQQKDYAANVEHASWKVEGRGSDSESYTLLLHSRGKITHETLSSSSKGSVDEAADSFNALRKKPEVSQWIHRSNHKLGYAGMVCLFLFLVGFVVWEDRKRLRMLIEEENRAKNQTPPPAKEPNHGAAPNETSSQGDGAEPSCPRCGERKFDGARCAACGGHLVPTAEVEDYMEKKHGLKKAELLELSGHFGGPKIECPACQTPMSPIQLSGAHVDLCPGCGGLWVDAGEKPLGG
jgi:hypothetical protein